MNVRQRVVFVGGGYATLHAYQVLARRRRREIRRGQLELVVISADDHHSFHGFTGEVLAGALPFEVTRASLRDAMPRAAIVPGMVTHVDREQQVVTYVRVGAAGNGAVETLRYDELVVAPGGREPIQDVPGLSEHGFTLRSPGDMRRLLARLVLLEHPAAGRQPSDLVVVGGGFAGVELAAALASRPTTVRGRRVHLVHSGTTVLPHLRDGQPGLARRAERELDRLGVEVHCGVRVVSVGRQHARPVRRSGPADLIGPLDHGPARRTAAGPGVTAGRRHRPAAHDSRLRGRPGHLGGRRRGARQPPRTRNPVPANALWAIKAGDHLGRNLARTVGGRATTPFRYLGLGQAAAFGVGRGVAELYGLPLTGWVAWVTRLAFFIRFMPSQANAVETLAFLVSRRSALPSVAGLPTGPGPVATPTRHAAVSTARLPRVGETRPSTVRSTVDERVKVA